MTVHKLTAGSGYTYLTRQVAAHDATDQAVGGLGAYYSDKGEAPGLWMGRGLAGMPDFPLGSTVTETQMFALFGQGRHPNAVQIEQAARLRGLDPQEVDLVSRLGRPYRVYEASGEFRRRCAIEFREFNTSHGLPHRVPVPAEERSRINTAVAREMFVEVYGRPALDARELSGHLARISRQTTTAVAGYDLTFSPVKSVSTLWAIAPREVSAVIEQAHADAVTDAVTWLEDHATYTRTGRNGVAQVDVRGLIATTFTHRDSRAGDPDLHTHVVISNKVQTLDDRWLALDGRAIYKNNVAASERYNTRIEALLADRLKLRFADRARSEADRRPVREVVGVAGPLPRFWSSRRSAIDTRRAVLATRFQADHGRPPTAKEAVHLAQQANLETRAAKHEPRSHADQRSAWRAEAGSVLGGDDAVEAYVRRALRTAPVSTPGAATEAWVAATADTVVSVMEGARASWQETHVRAETERQLRAAGIPVADLDRAGDAVVAAALAPDRSIRLGAVDVLHAVPGLLRRADGSSVFDVAGAAEYTSRRMLADEETVLIAAQRRDGHVAPADAVTAAVAASASHGMTLNPGQVQLVHELATSGARVQLALAPAGTGKTTAVRALAAAWTAGGGTLIGLAPSATASAVLREQLGSDTDTLAKLVHAVTTGVDVPTWVSSIGPSTLVVLDEAAMATTRDLARMVDFVTAAGGSVRLIGDDGQLGPIGAGGLLRELAHTQGAVRLTQVVRFIDPTTGAPNRAEGAASLALRDGDPTALAFYADRGRLHIGDPGAVVEHAFSAWATDRTAGRDAVLLAPTRDLVAQLNARARAERIEREGFSGPEVDLPDCGHASVGDVVITRRNDRMLRVGAGDWVKNGDRWSVTSVSDCGDLSVVHRRTNKHVTLPARYVQQHVTLGYATTVHGAQGITADRCHAIATGAESRQLLYVAMTRGRHENHLFLTTPDDGDPHSLITRDALLPPTAVDLLRRVLARDEAPSSATELSRAQDDPTTRLVRSVGQYHHALTVAAQQRVGSEVLSRIDAAAEQEVHGLTDEASYPVLRGHLALCAVAGSNPVELLRQAVRAPRGLGDARDVAAVLDWRLDPSGQRSLGIGPLPWLPAVPGPLRGDVEWAPYLDGRVQEIIELDARVRAETVSWTTTVDAPAWAFPLVDRDPALVADIAVWRAAHGIEDDEQRPTGPVLPGAADARSQRALDTRVACLLGQPGTVTERWRPLADSLEPRLRADPFWPVLCERMRSADRAGVDITSLVRSACVRSLPDEQPAAALWWRLTDHLSPAALLADQGSSRLLRPPWTPALAGVLGPDDADRVLADPQWPALVAAVDEGRDFGWPPADVLSTAFDLLRGAQSEGEPVPPHDLTRALLWRVGLLTDPPVSPGPDRDGLGTSAAAGSAPGAPWWLDLTEPDVVEPSPEGGDADADVGPTIDVPGLAERPSVERVRLLELNRLAAEHFVRAYPGSWAQAHLAERLGSDLLDDARFTIGCAPAGWSTLVDHLRGTGARDDEIVAAGLASYASTGQLIDRFRDRLVFAIQGGDGIHGWIGRCNPAGGDGAGRSTPKYLNTADTDLFTKGQELYGLIEGAPQLASGATAVLVEGPIDALAVTLAGEGEFVGVAPLGTAFTAAQADRLQGAIVSGRPDVLVGMDDDRAGHLAAERIFWKLTDRRQDPRHLVLPMGKDPGELLQRGGPDSLCEALREDASLASSLIGDRIDALEDRLDTVEGRVHATRRAAAVIAAVPSSTWPSHLTHVVARTGIAPDIALAEVLAAAEQRAGRDELARGAAGSACSTAGLRQPVVRGALANPVPGRGGARSRTPHDSIHVLRRDEVRPRTGGGLAR